MKKESFFKWRELEINTNFSKKWNHFFKKQILISKMDSCIKICNNIISKLFFKGKRIFLDISRLSNKPLISPHIHNFIKNEQESVLNELSIDFFIDHLWNSIFSSWWLFSFKQKNCLLSCYSWCTVAGNHIISNHWLCFLTFCHLPRLKFFWVIDILTSQKLLWIIWAYD